MDDPYLREYTEDRELSAWFLLDLSPSVDFGTAESDRQKRTVLIDFVTTLARLLTRRGNRVGAVLYGDRVERTIPAGSGRIQVLRLVEALLRQPRHAAAPFTDLRPLLDAGHKAIKRRSLVFVISDFISEPGWERSLDLLVRRHEVIAVRLVDPREATLPDVGPVILEDAETGEQVYRGHGRRGLPATVQRRCPGARGDDRRRLPARRRRGGDPVDRRRPCPLHRADGDPPRTTAAAIGMSFAWPQALVAAAPDPARRAGLSGDRPSPAAEGGRVRRGRDIRPSRPRPAHRRFRRTRPGGPRPGRTDRDGHRPGQAAGHDRRPEAGGHRRPRLRHLGQHGGDRPHTEPDGSRRGGSDRLRPPAAGERGRRRRRVQRLRDRGPAADQRPGRRHRRARPAAPATRDVARARDRRVAGRHRTGRGRSDGGLLQQPLAGADGVAGTRRRRDPRAGRHRAADRRREHPGPGSARSAQSAADRGIRIYTVGIGSESGATLDLDGFQVHTQLDAATLRAIADRTGGTYYGADDAETLKAIYDQIDTAFVVRPEQIELTGVFAAVGLGLLLAGAVISLAGAGRMP